jgi:hypothetical protein
LIGQQIRQERRHLHAQSLAGKDRRVQPVMLMEQKADQGDLDVTLLDRHGKREAARRDQKRAPCCICFHNPSRGHVATSIVLYLFLSPHAMGRRSFSAKTLGVHMEKPGLKPVR